ncbi:MAG: discoidin domain-containing protein, partial [Leptospiraceae bacterium]|nr:discoidin domain-containing protein [Leptospiraceae bacterium]
MMSQVRISHPEILLFSNWAAPGHTTESSGRVLGWVSDELETPTLVACTATFDDIRCFNSIQIDLHDEFRDFFPDTFRFEVSQDGVVWEPLFQESDFRAGLVNMAGWNFPLIRARHLKFLFLVDQPTGSDTYRCAFGDFRVGISGLINIETSSELDRLWVKENLKDGRTEYGWSSALRTSIEREHILLDLGSINRVSEIRALTKNDIETFFPEVFSFSYSEDNIAWHHLLEENGFLSEPGTWYNWRFVPTNMRYLRMDVARGARTREGKFISQIIELEFYASADSLEDPGRNVMSSPITHASVLRAGIVRLALDGEVREGVVVQGSDRRLRDATTESRGIVELATDGEEREGVVVQGHDRRLKYASEDLPGIVRLARDGENRMGHAVQSNDGRLKYASEEAAGLVELAADGESRPAVVVQGSDRRLRMATVREPGIVRLAENGSADPGEVVQGDDHRLRDATIETRGILRFARHNEESAEAAVQANDPRLRLASTEEPGIVELARDGESKAGAVVQGSDRRLRAATQEEAGIVQLSGHGGNRAGTAVQADDPRLSDARHPLKHEHEYAPIEHDYDSHSGFIQLKGELGDPHTTSVAPPMNYAPITGQNTGGGAGIVGTGKSQGVMGAADRTGVVGIGMEQGVGMLGAARFAPGGIFVSERSYGLVAGGKHEGHGLETSPLAMYVRGSSRFDDALHLRPGDVAASSIAVYFPVDSRDVYAAGDLVVAAGEKLRKSREYGSVG